RHTRFSRDWSSDVCSSDLHPDILFPHPAIQFLLELIKTQPGYGYGACLGQLDGAIARHQQLQLLVLLTEELQADTVTRADDIFRSEERRVGKEGGALW